MTLKKWLVVTLNNEVMDPCLKGHGDSRTGWYPYSNLSKLEDPSWGISVCVVCESYPRFLRPEYEGLEPPKASTNEVRPLEPPSNAQWFFMGKRIRIRFLGWLSFEGSPSPKKEKQAPRARELLRWKMGGVDLGLTNKEI